MIALPVDPIALVLLIPIGSAALLALLPNYAVTARLNVLAAFLTFLAAASWCSTI
jgi:hydrogenase-4 component F